MTKSDLPKPPFVVIKICQKPTCNASEVDLALDARVRAFRTLEQGGLHVITQIAKGDGGQYLPDFWWTVNEDDPLMAGVAGK